MVDAAGSVAGVLSVEVIGHALKTDPEQVRSGADSLLAEESMTLPLAQVQLRDRSADDASCVADNGLCPDWIVDNFDRYVDPFFEHVFLTVVSLAIGFAISFALALLAHRRRWLVAPDHPGHRDPVHDPEPGGLLPAAADHRARAAPRRSSRWWPTRC